MKTAFTVLLLAGLAACSSGDGYVRTEPAQGPRFDIAPGATVEIPVNVAAADSGDVDLTVEVASVSSDSFSPDSLTVALTRGSETIESDPGQPWRVKCSGDCRGEHLVSVSLDGQAPNEMTVDTSLVARLYTDDRRGADPVVEVSPIASASEWKVALDVSALWSLSNAGRLHVSAPVEPQGNLRLEMAPWTGGGKVDPLITDSPPHTRATAGNVVELVVPESGCGPDWCDWSMVVASVVPWRVTADSGEFPVSFQPLEGLLLEGATTWTRPITGGEELELDLEVRAPDFGGTDVAVTVSAREVVGRGQSHAPRDVDLVFGSEIVPFDRFDALPTVLIPLSCSDGTCRGAIPFSIDASRHEDDFVISVGMTAIMASTGPVTGRIEIDVRE